MNLFQLGVQLLVIPSFLWMIWAKRFRGRRDWLVHVLPLAAVSLGALITFRWDMSSYYLRLIFPIAFVLAAFVSYRKTARRGGGLRTPKTSDVVVGALVLAVAGVWIGYAVKGFSAPDDALSLSYPLRDGTYYVGGGGNSRIINNHQAVESQKFALDLVRLNASGNRAWPPFPGDLDDYTIFGDSVYAPCSGEIESAVDMYPDLNPPARDQVNLAGNHVVIECHDAKILLAHLMAGSIIVAEGDSVSDGQVIGLVGNSGNTSEPHLHIHAERGGSRGEILNGEGVPITLGGRFLVRNSLFNGRSSAGER